MKKLNITREEFRSVAGKMVACRAADALGISLSNFYYLAQQYSISTAFISKRWLPEQKRMAAKLRESGESHKSIGMRVDRSEGAVKTMLRNLRNSERLDMKRGAQ